LGRLITGLSNRYLAELGRISVAFQAVEYHLRVAVSLLLSTDSAVGHIVTAQLRGFEGLLSVLDSLYCLRVGDAKRRSRLERLLKRAADAEDTRNRFIHSVWTGQGDRRYRPHRHKITLKRGHGLRHDFQVVPLRELRKLAVELEKIGYDAIDLENELLAELPDR
jgi:hypothetical protein